MMDIQAVVALFFATVLLALVPGPVVAALVGRALASGARSTLGFLAGVFLADLIWLLAAVAGLAYLAATYSMLFLIVKYIGAVYLIYLGVQALRSACSKAQRIEVVGSASSQGLGFVSGLFITLGNPKLVAFYVGFLPTFINMQALSLIDTVAAAFVVPVTFCLVNFGWALLASKARTLFRSAKPIRALKLASGSLLLGSGVALVVNAQQ